MRLRPWCWNILCIGIWTIYMDGASWKRTYSNLLEIFLTVQGFSDGSWEPDVFSGENCLPKINWCSITGIFTWLNCATKHLLKPWWKKIRLLWWIIIQFPNVYDWRRNNIKICQLCQIEGEHKGCEVAKYLDPGWVNRRGLVLIMEIFHWQTLGGWRLMDKNCSITFLAQCKTFFSSN